MICQIEKWIFCKLRDMELELFICRMSVFRIIIIIVSSSSTTSNSRQLLCIANHCSHLSIYSASFQSSARAHHSLDARICTSSSYTLFNAMSLSLHKNCYNTQQWQTSAGTLNMGGNVSCALCCVSLDSRKENMEKYVQTIYINSVESEWLERAAQCQCCTTCVSTSSTWQLSLTHWNRSINQLRFIFCLHSTSSSILMWNCVARLPPSPLPPLFDFGFEEAERKKSRTRNQIHNDDGNGQSFWIDGERKTQFVDVDTSDISFKVFLFEFRKYDL